ncbi:15117_t:CDS:2 [Dentiscutata erythropus]|uniref:15117_t:CDS:1 n=1 Tax=Dentiscutata erythropus TaxID=1348616 RepID=A0A9N9HL79_9GLOM|nr:15117_t:CDS:2 [Dentiscutata erythropus]
MPKKFKGESTKVTASKERKAAHQAEVNKVKQAEKDRKEAEEWSTGAKDSSKKESQKLKREAQLAKKNEAARLLEQEESQLSKHKPLMKKKAIKRTQNQEKASAERREIPEFSASNIDDALDLMTVVTNSSTAVGGGPGQSGGAVNVEKHPEKRFKAALAAYEEREMPKVKEEHPGLRYTQYREIIYKNFQKSPENPFNQANILRYNSSRQEQDTLIEATRKDLEDRLRV